MKRYRIVSTQKQTAQVLDVRENIELTCFFPRKLKPICGDFVSLENKNDEWVINEIHPSHNVFARANHKGQKQQIAANVDNQIIVVAVEPEPTRDRSETTHCPRLSAGLITFSICSFRDANMSNNSVFGCKCSE